MTSDGGIATSGATRAFTNWVYSGVLEVVPDGNGNYHSDYSSLEYRASRNEKGTLPARNVFDVFVLNAEHSGGSQTLLGWDYHPKGYANLQKSTRSTW